MRENRTYGSEGGEGSHPFPTPIKKWAQRGFLDPPHNCGRRSRQGVARS
jgi:hypothetical protein